MLTNVAEKASQFDDVEAVKQAIKNIQSVKWRLKKMKSRPDYETEMEKVLKEEQLLKEVRDYMEPKKLTFTTMTDEQIAELTYEETIRAIKSVQSKKCNSQYATEDINTNVEYQEAVRLEKVLLAHKATVSPVDENMLRKSDVRALIEHLETLKEIPKEYILERLVALIEE